MLTPFTRDDRAPVRPARGSLGRSLAPTLVCARNLAGRGHESQGAPPLSAGLDDRPDPEALKLPKPENRLPACKTIDWPTVIETRSAMP
jgi:hypothetical protein